MIVKFLKWALSKFEPKPTLAEKLAACPFPLEEVPKPAVKKATTRPAVKKATTVAKKTTKKAK
jgi:hypothetical protein